MFENRWGFGSRVGLCCLAARAANSRAKNRPIRVTRSADSLRRGCMVITGDLAGKTLSVRRRPATMLPHASRLRGLMTWGLFSLMGEKEFTRGLPMTT